MLLGKRLKEPKKYITCTNMPNSIGTLLRHTTIRIPLKSTGLRLLIRTPMLKWLTNILNSWRRGRLRCYRGCKIHTVRRRQLLPD